jgi:hypothetical protein
MVMLHSLHRGVVSDRDEMHHQRRSSHHAVNNDAGAGWMFLI